MIILMCLSSRRLEPLRKEDKYEWLGMIHVMERNYEPALPFLREKIASKLRRKEEKGTNAERDWPYLHVMGSQLHLMTWHYILIPVCTEAPQQALPGRQ